MPTYAQQVNQIRANLSTSFWLSDALRDMDKRDPLDVLNDCYRLLELATQRYNEAAAVSYIPPSVVRNDLPVEERTTRQLIRDLGHLTSERVVETIDTTVEGIAKQWEYFDAIAVAGGPHTFRKQTDATKRGATANFGDIGHAEATVHHENIAKAVAKRTTKRQQELHEDPEVLARWEAACRRSSRDYV